MSFFKVTHIGPDLQRHQRTVPAASTAQAQAWMEQLYGQALALAAVRVGPLP
ncbi:hypothetical protein KW843_07565 [Acidovorax sp. sif1233]|uniref:hypothetical protein n=1 Tax=Acidovorax sp. sif1233 TaxID=2854792 RepID=UPI001C496984|nr:hypothetical protein [Acidovorax sp. sif1233]MBV7454324.1 hypothetical protein [Acidovorax sp. sif1233]